MPNTREKEKLIELLKLSDACICDLCGEEGALDRVAGVIADNLIANGVTFKDRDIHWATEQAYKNGYAKAVKEFAEKIDECLKRYSHLHKYAKEAKHSTEEFADGTPMEMISVWDVLPLVKWGMVEYETMNTLQENIETIATERLLTEFEKDFRILIREMVGAEPPKGE